MNKVNSHRHKHQKKDVNIFLITAPMQFIAYRLLIDKLPPETIVFDLRPISYSRFRWMYYVYRLVQFRITTFKLLYNHNIDMLYAAHPYHFASNFFWWRCRRITLLQDGLLNYYNCYTETVIRGMVIKKLLYSFFMLPYRIYNGHLTAYNDPHVQSGYFFSVKNLITKTPDNRTLEMDSCLNPDSTVCLFLDHELNASASQISTVNNMIEDYLIKNQITKIYIKKHPSYPVCNFATDKVLSHVLENVTEPIELCYAQLKPMHILSYYSSAIVNIKIINPNIKSIAFGVKLIKDEATRNQIIDMFKQFEVLTL